MIQNVSSNYIGGVQPVLTREQQLDYTAEVKNRDYDSFIASKVSQGYSKVNDTTLTKKDNDLTSEITINKDKGDYTITEFKDVQVSVSKPKPEFEQIESEIHKAEQALKSASGNSYIGIQNRLDQLYQARDDLANTGNSNYTYLTYQPQQVSQSKEVSLSPMTASDLVNKNLPQLNFNATVQEGIRKDNMLPSLDVTSFTTPRVYSPQETMNVYSPISSNVNIPIAKTMGDLYPNTMKASQPSDFLYSNNLTPLERIEYKYSAAPSQALLNRGELGLIAGTGAYLGGQLIVGASRPAQAIIENPFVEIPKTIAIGTLIGATGGLGIALAGGYAGGQIVSSGSIGEATQKVGENAFYIASFHAGGKSFETIKDASPKFTRIDVVGGTEQYLKYGDNRGSKQFDISQKEGTFELNPNVRGQVVLSGDYPKGSGAMRYENPGFRFSDVKDNVPREIQKTLDNKNAQSISRDAEDYMVRDNTESVQQRITFTKEVNFNEDGGISSINTGIKLKPIESVYSEPTTRVSTQFYTPKSRMIGEIDTLGESVGSNQEKFSNLDLSGRGKGDMSGRIHSNSYYNQELVLVESETRGRVIDTSILNAERVGEPNPQSTGSKSILLSLNKLGVQLSQSPIQIQSQNQVQLQQQIQSQSPKQIQSQSPIQLQELSQFQIQSQNQVQLQKQVQIQSQAQVQLQQQKQEQKQESRLKEQTITKPNVEIGFNLKDTITAHKKKVASKFEAVTKRHGKLVIIPNSMSDNPRTSLLKGENLVKSTLARSLGVVDVESRKFVNTNTLPSGFRQSKKPSNFIIQSNALSSFSEVGEIQQARRSKMMGGRGFGEGLI